ncbi:hypothetical protein BDQ17DRAFT_1349829 [Cyathus striatus]|nr:hypothetical protein BDQ17DRAFT_1349829 [Cyathus striatus]
MTHIMHEISLKDEGDATCSYPEENISYMLQTATAEENAVRPGKEAECRFGLASPVCDPEEY